MTLIRQFLALGIWMVTAAAAVPHLLSYQGRLAVGVMAFDGAGQFKFALVNATASQMYWGNATDGNGDSQPDNPVSLTVVKGLYSVHLGDTTLANMAALPADVFANDEVYLRVWFNDGTNGFQRLSPDQRVVAVGYALMAAAVADGSITTNKLEATLATQIETAASAGLTVVSTEPQDASLIGKGFAFFTSVAAPSWANGSATDTVTPRYAHSATWTGTEWIVWGGNLGGGTYSAQGGRYQPLSDSWTAVSPVDAPSARSGHTAVWSGTEMIIWGGFSPGGYLNTGGRFHPGHQQWNSVTNIGAPASREGHNAVWTGSRMIVWGGHDGTSLLADGAFYDPDANQWTAINLSGAPAARCKATVVWTGSRLLVWGGLGESGELSAGAQLLVTSGTTPTAWEAISAVNAPSARVGHSAVWTGQLMIIWGGQQGNTPLATGATYNPATDTWTALPSPGAPLARTGHCAVWNGTEMIVWGGDTGSGATATGAAYNPATGKWRALSNGGVPIARSGATATWTGSEMLVFGGRTSGQVVSALQRVNPQPAWHFYRKL